MQRSRNEPKKKTLRGDISWRAKVFGRSIQYKVHGHCEPQPTSETKYFGNSTTTRWLDILAVMKLTERYRQDTTRLE